MIGRLRKIPLSELYDSGGASGFSSWLQKNLDVLNEAVDLSLTNVEGEDAGSTSNVVAKDGSGRNVVVENQLESSDDGALGKLIMGMAETNSKSGVWIVGDSNDQHVSAVSWLNDNARDAAFYLLTVEAYRIDDSPPAPVMTLVSGPDGGSGDNASNGETNEINDVSPTDTYVSGDPAAGQEPYITGDPSAGEDPVTYISGDPHAGEEVPDEVLEAEASEEEVANEGSSETTSESSEVADGGDMNESESLRAFWTGLLDKARERTRIHGDTEPTEERVVGASAGLAGLDYNYVLRDHDASVELYVDRGENRESENETIYNALSATQDAIEYNFGGDLKWQQAENSPARRIENTVDTGGLLDQDRWPETQDSMVDTMIRLERSLHSHIARIQL